MKLLLNNQVACEYLDASKVPRSRKFMRHKNISDSIARSLRAARRETYQRNSNPALAAHVSLHIL